MLADHAGYGAWDDDPVAGGAALATLYRELSAEGWPAALLARSLPQALSYCRFLDPCDRSAWMAGMLHCWHKHGWALDRQARRNLLELAAWWCMWPLAAQVGEALGPVTPAAAGEALRLIEAWRHVGRAGDAMALAARLQQMAPGEHRFADTYADLLAWADWRKRVPGAAGQDWDEPDLSLEPMAHHHDNDFAWQYHDPSIAELCCLPLFNDGAVWHRWLDELYRYGDQVVYAIEHRSWGFIGNASLVVHDGAGFFYYWLGPDFQGQGFGPRAVSLLLAMAAKEYGLRCCYAKAFDYNARSRRALQKLGFEDLGLRGAGADADQMFFRWGAPCSRADAASELSLLLERMDAETRPAMPRPGACD